MNKSFPHKSIHIPHSHFFNYAGLHRPVRIYSTPHDYIEDIVIVPNVDLDSKKADVQVSVKTVGAFDEVRVTILDENGKTVAQNSGTEITVTIEDVQLWQPLNAYLYTAKVEGLKNGEAVDVYEEPFGIRKVEVKNGKFLITPAVGLFLMFNFDVSVLEKGGDIKDETWTTMNTSVAHKQVIRELIDRDKNHACVVMWDCQRGGDLCKRLL